MGRLNMDVTKDYTAFDPQAYLQEYYADIGPENQALLGFLVRGFRDVPADSLVLDLGGGPALYATIAAAAKAREIHFADYSLANLDEIRKWIQRRPDAFDWKEFVGAVLEQEGVGRSPQDIAAREDRVRARLTRLMHCDVKRPCPIDDVPAQYDVVMTNFCAEAAATDRAEWFHCMCNIASLLRPGGRLLLSTIKGAQSYGVGEAAFFAVHLVENDLQEMLLQTGFDPASIAIRTEPADRPERHYQALMFATATKLAGTS
ncbi:MAG: hypothetical protein A2Y73_03305 [Chloroflexi bacterium RBG_13_56_8]|nr:MAG: hypothetical protein A2Y73_03305 [Chloroflexi bacterium RBG_13_56_8]